MESHYIVNIYNILYYIIIMNLTYLIEQGYLKDTKEGYVVQKNFPFQNLCEVTDKPIIIPANSTVDLSDYGGEPIFACEERVK